MARRKLYRLHTYSRITGGIVSISHAFPLANLERIAGGSKGQHRTTVDVIQPA